MREFGRLPHKIGEEERRERLAYLPETAWYYLRTFGHMAIDSLLSHLEERGPLPSALGAVQKMMKNGRIEELYTEDGKHHLQAVGPIMDNDGPAKPDLTSVSEDQSPAQRSS
jgi:hypothetical protein